MKKLLAFLLSATMVCSTVVTASAVGPSSAETTVTQTGSGTEQWTVEVPETLEPDTEGIVKLYGTWGANRRVIVEVEDGYGQMSRK